MEGHAAILDLLEKRSCINFFAKNVLSIARLSVLHLDRKDGKLEVLLFWFTPRCDLLLQNSGNGRAWLG